MLFPTLIAILAFVVLSSFAGDGTSPAAPVLHRTHADQVASNSVVAAGAYDPPPGAYPFFPFSIFQRHIPIHPSVNPNTQAWLAQLGHLGIGKLQFHAANAGDLSQDYTFPIYPMSALAPGATRVRIHCTAGWGTCSIEGKTYTVGASELPEDGGAPNEDSHLGLIDLAGGREIDFFGVQWPPKNGVLDIAWGGECSLLKNGYDGTGCASTATGTPLSLGILRVSDLMLALGSPTGSLPYALQVATKCSDGKVAPMLGSDGHTPGCAPQGSRVYLAMHDAEVDAGSQSPIEKVLLRTIDEDHFGMIITDTNGGQDGFCLQAESDLTYTAFGRPGPLVTVFVPEAFREGLPGANSPYKGTYYIALPMDGVDFAGKLKFL